MLKSTIEIDFIIILILIFWHSRKLSVFVIFVFLEKNSK